MLSRHHAMARMASVVATAVLLGLALHASRTFAASSSASVVVSSTPEPTRVPEELLPPQMLAQQSASQASESCVGIKCVFPVRASADDAGPVGPPAGVFGPCTYSTAFGEVYIGECPDGAPITSGFRFPDVTLPNGAEFSQAYLEFTVDGPFKNNVLVDIYGEAMPGAASFGDAPNRPEDRDLTTATVSWTITTRDKWDLGHVRRTPDISPIIQEIVQGSWEEGDALAIILRSVPLGSLSDPDPLLRHRKVVGFDRPPSTYVGDVPRLVVILRCEDTAIVPALSGGGEAVRDAVGIQNYCENQYEGLSFTPGAPSAQLNGFDDWADLAKSAEMEVLFTTMEYDAYGGEPRSSPGDILAEAIGYLYQRIVSDPTLYPQGLTIRVLVRDDTVLPLISPDLRMRVLDDVRRNGVLELENEEIGWKLEVAHYRNSFTTQIYSHAKFMVVDGSSVLAAGYNMTSDHLEDLVDFGIRATGPVAHDALMKFDYLWQGGVARSCDLASPIWKLTCSNVAVETGHSADAEAIRVTGGDTNAFSLFRAGEPGMNEADDAVKAVLSSAQNSIEVLNPWFTLHSIELFPDLESYDFDNLAPDYMIGLRDAIVSNDNAGNAAFKVRILLAPDGIPFLSERWNELGIKAFLSELGDLERYVEFKIFAGASHAKVSVVDEQFIVVGSQNWSYAAFGDNDDDWDHPEYSLGVDSLVAAGDFIDNYFYGGFGYWNLGTERTIVRDGDDLKAAIENASNGDIIAIHGERFEITDPIEITSEIKIISTGSTLLPGSPLTDAGSARLASLVQPTEEPLIRILASNVEVSGLRIEGAEGIGIEIGEEAGDIENVQISYVTFDGNGKAGVRVRGETADYRIENSTFIGGQFGIMIWLEDDEQLAQSVIRNNIFMSQWFAPIDIFPTDGGETEYSYNLFFQCDAGSCEDLFINGQPGQNSIVHDNLFDVDPEFVNPTGGDYSLTASSPAIDAGDPSVEGQYIPDGDGDGIGQIDMGAFEFVPTDNSPPVANAGGPYASSEGSPIAFDASGSSDPDGDPLEFKWDFDADGAFDTTYSPDATATFAFEDDFAGEALLKVRDSRGLTDTSVAAMQIANVAPSVDAGADMIVEVGIQLQFSGSFTDLGILDTHTLLWDFGDGDTAEGTLAPTHSFDSAGTYEVTFTVTDDDAGFGSDTLTVAVAEAGSGLRYFVWLPMVLR